MTSNLQLQRLLGVRLQQRNQMLGLTCEYGRTRIRFFLSGLGDIMIARQFTASFLEFCSEYGDPRWGCVSISGGASPIVWYCPKSDLNLYWWWSMGRRDDWLDVYLSNVEKRPDLILCPSGKTLSAAHSRGLLAIYLPLGVSSVFRPLGLERKGIGYAGSKNHKDALQERQLIGAAAQFSDLDWVDSISAPDELNRWYNTKALALGMTEKVQERWGMVNNRVFEALASGTPFLIHKHGNLNQTLDFDYPFQSSSPDETKEWTLEIMNNNKKYLDLFADYSRRIREKHAYCERIKTLYEKL